MRKSIGIYQRLMTGRYYKLVIDDVGWFIATPWSNKYGRPRRGERQRVGMFNPIEWQFIGEA